MIPPIPLNNMANPPRNIENNMGGGVSSNIYHVPSIF